MKLLRHAQTAPQPATSRSSTRLGATRSLGASLTIHLTVMLLFSISYGRTPIQTGAARTVRVASVNPSGHRIPRRVYRDVAVEPSGEVVDLFDEPADYESFDVAHSDSIAWLEESLAPAFELTDPFAELPASIRFVVPAAVEVQEFTDPVAALERPVTEPERPEAETEPELADEEAVATADAGESEVGNEEEAARITFGMPPAYPKVALRMGWEGSCLCAIVLDAEGKVTSVEILESSGYDVLDEAATKAIRGWKFAAATKGGVAIDGRLEHRIRFRING